MNTLEKFKKKFPHKIVLLYFPGQPWGSPHYGLFAQERAFEWVMNPHKKWYCEAVESFDDPLEAFERMKHLQLREQERLIPRRVRDCSLAKTFSLFSRRPSVVDGHVVMNMTNVITDENGEIFDEEFCPECGARFVSAFSKYVRHPTVGQIRIPELFQWRDGISRDVVGV